METIARSKSSQLHDEACRYIPGGSSKANGWYAPHPIYAAEGKGCRLTDADGVERLDFLNGYTALIHGHADPDVSAAAIAQIQRGTAFSAPVEAEVALAKLLCARVPAMEMVRFGCSGTESVMMAIKAARAFTGRDRIAKFEGFYHGYYDEIQVSYASSEADWGPAEAPASTPSSGGLAASTLRDVLVLPYNDRIATTRLLEAYASEVAAVIVDPMSNRGGLIEPRAQFLSYLRQLTERLGILLIFDEVISFRVSYEGAQGHYNVRPDLSVLGKIIGGGFPVGATGGRAEVMRVFDPTGGKAKIASGGTFAANPLTMVAGRAAMEKMTRAEFKRLNALGDRLRMESNERFERRGVPGQVNGLGSLFRIHGTSMAFASYRDTIDRVAAARVLRLHALMMEEGVIVHTNGLGCLSTPMGDEEVDLFVAALDRALGRLSG